MCAVWGTERDLERGERGQGSDATCFAVQFIFEISNFVVMTSSSESTSRGMALYRITHVTSLLSTFLSRESLPYTTAKSKWF